MEGTSESRNKIFSAICDIVVEQEFVQSQADFYIKNCKVFKDEEENSHEYMKIFEEYVYIIDQAIESKLSSDFEQDQVEDFYKTFKDNYENYKAINYDTVDLLFNSIDFDNFKKTMLRFKDGMVNEKESERDPNKANLGEAGEEKFKGILHEQHDAKYKWRKMVEMKDTKHGFSGQLYMRPSEESPIDMLWIDVRVNNCTPEEFVKLFENGPPVKFALERRKVRDFNDTQSLIYAKIKLPMIDPREQVIKRTVKKQEDGSILHLLQSVMDDEFPIVDGVVRAQMYKCQVLRQAEDNPKDCVMTDISSMDLKGRFPARMINMIASQTLSKAFPELVKIIRESQ